MKLFSVLIVILFAGLLVQAQEDDEPDYTVLECEGIQAWYEAQIEVYAGVVEQAAALVEAEDA